MKECTMRLKTWLAGLAGAAVAWAAVAWGAVAWGGEGIEVRTEWAYHGAGDEGRFGMVPGMKETWLCGGGERVLDGEAVTLWVMTDHDFGGEADEQVYARWWDGYMAHWIQGIWEKNLRLGAEGDGRVEGKPEEGEMLVDLWRIEVPAWVTQPGENYYAIQLKASKGESDWDAKYLLREAAGDFSRKNGLGQVYSSSEEFDGADWRVLVGP